MRRTFRWACGTAAALLLATGPAEAAHRRGWDHASSLGRNLLVATALGMPAIRGD